MNDEPVTGRRRLRDGDVIRFGTTVALYYGTAHPLDMTTIVSSEQSPSAATSKSRIKRKLT